jgi:molybdate transport system ATP-binding protein
MGKYSQTKDSDNRFIAFENVTLRIRDRHILPSTDWKIKKNQNWAVLGPNGSGKSTLLRSFVGNTPVVGGYIKRYGPQAQPGAIGFVSFELHQKFIAREQVIDESRYFSGNFDSYLTVEQVIEAVLKQRSNCSLPTAKLLSIFDIDALMPRPIRKLSTGEMRKILILRAVVQAKSLLVLDEPFAGLDRKSRGQLKDSIEALIQAGIQIVLATHRYENIIPAISHILFLKEGSVFDLGNREQVFTVDIIDRVFGGKIKKSSVGPGASRPIPATGDTGPVVIEVRNTAVRYGQTVVFNDLNWRVRKGENWAIVGPNGSGKTTLLQLITADHPQAYTNEIYLFGKRRGSGESIWEIKKRMGQLSSEFQINYRKAIRSFDVVLSGFFSSVGLYRRASDTQRKIAKRWVYRLKLDHLMDKRYDLLSYGERRMILLARAVVTTPEILVLDEPFQGLDLYHRHLILAWIDNICDRIDTQLLYVTHHLNELPACISHIFDLEAKRGFRKPAHLPGVESTTPFCQWPVRPLVRDHRPDGNTGQQAYGNTGKRANGRTG